MQRWAAGLLVLACSGVFSGAAGAASAAEPRKSRSLSSVNALWKLQMVEVEEGRCRLEATKDRELAWTLERCVGTADDLYFISNDGSRFWVLHTLPEKPPKKSRQKWFKAPVAGLYDAKGELKQQRRLSDYVPRKKLGEVKQLTKRFKWLLGVAGERGVLPRLNAQGQVEFETVLGKTHRLVLETQN